MNTLIVAATPPQRLRGRAHRPTRQARLVLQTVLVSNRHERHQSFPFSPQRLEAPHGFLRRPLTATSRQRCPQCSTRIRW
jgi:hypothetical protein